MRKCTVFIFAVLILFLSSCGFFKKEEEPAQEDSNAPGTEERLDAPKYTASVLLPNEREHKWLRTAGYLEEELEKMGFAAVFSYARDDDGLQASQIDDSVYSETDCIIVAPVDSYSNRIREAAEKAKKAEIPVIAYDRLIMDTDAVDIYVAVDPYLLGRICGQYALAMLSQVNGTANAEFLMGSEKDSSAPFFYSGAMDVLMPYIDNGKINVPSKLISFRQTSVETPENSREYMASRIGVHYSGDIAVNAVIASNGESALGVINALDSEGYGDNGDFPAVVSVGADRENILRIAKGKQAAAAFADERIVAGRLAETANSVSFGIIPPNTDKTTFNNGVKIVPALLIEPVLLEKGNYKEILIGGEYYSYTDLNP